MSTSRIRVRTRQATPSLGAGGLVTERIDHSQRWGAMKQRIVGQEVEWLRRTVERIFRQRSRGAHRAPARLALPKGRTHLPACQQSGVPTSNSAPGRSVARPRTPPAGMRQAVVEMGCSATGQGFCVRFDSTGEGWEATQLMRRKGPASSSAADRPAQTALTGRIASAATFPGCPYCGNRRFVRCGACDRVSCFAERTTAFTCPWCGNAGPVEEGLDRLDGSAHTHLGSPPRTARTIGGGQRSGPEVRGSRSGPSLPGR